LAYQKNENNSFEVEMIVHFLHDKFLDDYFLKLNKQRIDDIFPDKLIDLIYIVCYSAIFQINLKKKIHLKNDQKCHLIKLPI